MFSTYQQTSPSCCQYYFCIYSRSAHCGTKMASNKQKKDIKWENKNENGIFSCFAPCHHLRGEMKWGNCGNSVTPHNHNILTLASRDEIDTSLQPLTKKRERKRCFLLLPKWKTKKNPSVKCKLMAICVILRISSCSKKFPFIFLLRQFHFNGSRALFFSHLLMGCFENFLKLEIICEQIEKNKLENFNLNIYDLHAFKAR